MTTVLETVLGEKNKVFPKEQKLVACLRDSQFKCSPPPLLSLGGNSALHLFQFPLLSFR